MIKAKTLLFLVLIFIIGGCVSTSLPDYDKISSAEQAGPHYVARNIKISYDDNTPSYEIMLLKKVEVVGDERYYVVYETYSRMASNKSFAVDSIIFSVDGNFISLTPNDYFENKIYSIGNQYISETSKFFYEITEQQLWEIALGNNVLVLAKSGAKVDQGKLLQENIDRFRIFLEKFGDK